MFRHLPTAQGLHAEQDLLASVCKGEQTGGVLFWCPTDRALVMPRRMSRLPGFEEASLASAASGWPVLLRETGGEPVPQSSSTVNVALVYVAPQHEGDQHRIETAYRRLCQPLLDALERLGGAASLGEIEGAFCDGRFNVNLDGRKWVGTAQRWRQGLSGTRPVVLVHGAMLMDDERESMAAAVNLFNERCGLEQRVQASSHIALHERHPAPELFDELDAVYTRLLSDLA